MSETTTTTGWHMHHIDFPETGAVCRDNHCRFPEAVVSVGPVVVLDPADPAVRETIARALREVDDAVLVGTNFDRICASYDEQASAVLAALASATEGAGA